MQTSTEMVIKSLLFCSRPGNQVKELKTLTEFSLGSGNSEIAVDTCSENMAMNISKAYRAKVIKQLTLSLKNFTV